MQTDIQELSSHNLDAIYLTLLDMEDLLQMTEGNQISIGSLFVHGSAQIPGNRNGRSAQFRLPAVQKLQALGIITDCVPPYGTYDGLFDVAFKIRADRNKLEELRNVLANERASRGLALAYGPLASRSQTKKVLEWHQLKLALVSDTEIKASLEGSTSKRYSMSQLGLNDGRKGDVASDLWAALQFLAEHDGVMSAHRNWDPKMQKKIQRLGKKLSTFFKIDGSPFDPYSKTQGYRSKFTIMDKRSGQDADQSSEDEITKEARDATSNYQIEKPLRT